jgi:hypothetical protein
MITIQLNFTLDEISKYLINTGRWGISDVNYITIENKIEVLKTIKIAYPIDIPIENFIPLKSEIQLLEWEVTKIFEHEIKLKILNYD